MAAVGGGADPHVFRRRLRPALHDGLQIFIGGLVFLKGQIIQKQKKTVVAALYLPQNVGDQVILLLVKLNEPQSLIGVLVDEGLDTGGFSGTGIAVEQHVVAALPPQKGFRIADQQILLLPVAHQIRQTHRRTVLHGDQLRAVPCPSGPEHLPHAQQTDAPGLVERRQAVQQPLRGIGGGQFPTERQKRGAICGMAALVAEVPQQRPHPALQRRVQQLKKELHICQCQCFQCVLSAGMPLPREGERVFA